MGDIAKCVGGVLRDDSHHILFLSGDGESGSGAYELGDFDHECGDFLRGGILLHLCEDGIQGAGGGDFAVPDHCYVVRWRCVVGWVGELCIKYSERAYFVGGKRLFRALDILVGLMSIIGDERSI